MGHPGDDQSKVCKAQQILQFHHNIAGPYHARFLVPRMCTGSRHAHLAVTSLEVPYANSAISVPSCYMRPSGACSHLRNLPCCFPLRHLRCHQKLCLHLARFHGLLEWINTTQPAYEMQVWACVKKKMRFHISLICSELSALKQVDLCWQILTWVPWRRFHRAIFSCTAVITSLPLLSLSSAVPDVTTPKDLPSS